MLPGKNDYNGVALIIIPLTIFQLILPVNSTYTWIFISCVMKESTLFSTCTLCSTSCHMFSIQYNSMGLYYWIYSITFWDAALRSSIDEFYSEHSALEHVVFIAGIYVYIYNNMTSNPSTSLFLYFVISMTGMLVYATNSNSSPPVD